MRVPGTSAFSRVAITVTLAGVIAACATNPATGRRQLSLVSESDEIAMGRQASQEVEQTLGLVEDAELQAYVSRVGMAMARQSERPNLPWKFGVVDDPAPNAFALPGGPIYLTRGMATLMRSEAEMASVLGHEIAHVTARHSVSQISRQQLAQLGLGIGGLLSERVRQYGGLLGTGMSLLFLQHSRDAEREADDIGFRYAHSRGYAMSEMADVFRSLERMSSPERSALPTFLTTHPSPGARVETITAKVAALPANSRGRIVGENEYLREIDGLVYGEDPRQGFFRDGQFLHPDLRFQFMFPSGWQGQNTKQAVLGVSQRQDAALQLTLSNQRSPQAAAQQFQSQTGIALSNAGSEDINGLPSVVSSFQANTESGAIAGLAAWISHGGHVYQLITYAPSASFSAQQRTFERVISSFGVLRDQAALSAQPKRVDIVQVPERLTLTEFNRRMPSAITIDALAVINELAGPSAVLNQGMLAKRVLAGRGTN
jgi:predicted Zn-dependent protease